MIPHHQQAVQMSSMAERHASTPEVTELAAKIAAAQGPEIETMTGWLEDWGQDVPEGDGMGMGGDMGSMDMNGMMSGQDMEDLDSARGASFDRMWLTMMIEHHEGAVEMAQDEKSKGQNADAVALAEKIEADQTAEIAVMKDLLES